MHKPAGGEVNTASVHFWTAANLPYEPWTTGQTATQLTVFLNFRSTNSELKNLPDLAKAVPWPPCSAHVWKASCWNSAAVSNCSALRFKSSNMCLLLRIRRKIYGFKQPAWESRDRQTSPAADQAQRILLLQAINSISLQCTYSTSWQKCSAMIGGLYYQQMVLIGWSFLVPYHCPLQNKLPLKHLYRAIITPSNFCEFYFLKSFISKYLQNWGTAATAHC